MASHRRRARVLRSVWIAASVFLLAAFLVSVFVRWGVFTHGPILGAPGGPQQRDERHLLFGRGSISYVTMRTGAFASFDEVPGASKKLAWRAQGGRWWLPYFESIKSRGTLAVAPLWIPATLIGGACAFVVARERSRRRGGRCARCGYMLGGLPSGAACPECGGE